MIFQIKSNKNTVRKIISWSSKRNYSTKPPLSQVDIAEHLKRLLGPKFDPRYIPTPKQLEAMMAELSENGEPSKAKVEANFMQMQFELTQAEAQLQSLNARITTDEALIEEQETIISQKKTIIKETIYLVEQNEALLKRNKEAYESNKILVKRKQKDFELQKQLIENAKIILKNDTEN